MLTRQQAQAIHAALFTLDNAGRPWNAVNYTGTRICVTNNGTTSTVWMDDGTVYMLVEYSNGDESEHEFSSLDDFLNSSR